jgi:type II secretory pathway pseudopilin PulG
MTLIEATIARAVVSGLMLAAVASMGATGRARQVQSSYGRGYVLAQNLMEETASARYTDPNIPTNFGREAGETATSRANYDDVDDYDGWSATPPTDKANNALPGLTGWKQQVSVVWADPNNPSANSSTDQGLKRITVTITDPRGRQTVLTSLRSRKSIFDTVPTPSSLTYIKWVNLNIQVGSDSGAAVSAGASLPNRPAHP